MRIVTWVLLLGLAALAANAGQLRWGLSLAGAKVVLIGLEYMELRGAHRLHATAFVLFTGAWVGLLLLVA